MQQKEAKIKKEIKDAQAERDEVRFSFALLMQLEGLKDLKPANLFTQTLLGQPVHAYMLVIYGTLVAAPLRYA